MIPVTGLRSRITLLVVGVVAVCLLASFVAVYRGTASRLETSTDRGLREDMRELRATVLGGSTAQELRAARAYIARQPYRATTHVMFVVAPRHEAVTNEPELLDTSGGDADDTPSERAEEAHDATLVLGAPPGLSEQRLPGVGPVRVLIARSDGIRLGVAEPVEPITQAKHTVSRAFLLAGALGMLAALLGALLIASRVSAPLRRMARVATAVDAGDLSPRMELDGRRDEVRTLAHSFDQMLDRLEDAFARQSAFVADAGHELRTPLTIMRGQLEVLMLNPRPSPADIRHVERLVLPEIDRMSRIVDDLVLLAHAADEDLLRPEPIDLPEFLAGVCDGLRATTDRRIDLAPVPPIVFEADPDRLAQALRNLLRNAIVHTDPDGQVSLSVHQRDRRLRFIIDDTGPGIPPAQRERIFDRFARLDTARGRDQGGAGLGLSIVKAITLAHGGEVHVTSSPGGGARFIIELPQAELPAQPVAVQGDQTTVPRLNAT